ncbi:MAG: acylphosphatase, partial [Rhodothermales bacterium]
MTPLNFSSHERLSARVVGRVQGVYFRAFTRNQARRLGLHGWVRNDDDGSVYLEAEGPRAILD